MQHLILTYGLVAIVVLMAAESACIPIPSEVTMLLGGALAAGAVGGAHPNLVAVIVAGTLGNVAGSYLAWLAGRWGGRPALHRWGRYVLLRTEEVDRAQEWFDRHGRAAVFWARLLPGIRTFISLPAGIAEMPGMRFGIYTVAGCLPWTAALAIGGYFAGANWRHVEDVLRGPSYAVAAVVGLAIVTAGVLYLRRRSRRQAGPAGAVDVQPDRTAR
ncbi:DedA family protein [Nocardia africana]|uniref:SNARE associated Golgi protein n=1 Tax=Nocardia africana TaxID=134964 RepID=A0A378WU96_9NOCA|nr:DedA family protein [Nocardia africana]MCC3313802.1 DedA family protein [Nocardia africana]SUA44816.1 SNARE associated Golgi protein [Nocardia africana]